MGQSQPRRKKSNLYANVEDRGVQNTVSDPRRSERDATAADVAVIDPGQGQRPGTMPGVCDGVMPNNSSGDRDGHEMGAAWAECVTLAP